MMVYKPRLIYSPLVFGVAHFILFRCSLHIRSFNWDPGGVAFANNFPRSHIVTPSIANYLSSFLSFSLGFPFVLTSADDLVVLEKGQP